VNVSNSRREEPPKRGRAPREPKEPREKAKHPVLRALGRTLATLICLGIMVCSLAAVAAVYYAVQATANDGNLLEERADNAHALQVGNPILTSVDLMKIRDMKQPGFQVETVSILYYKNTPLKRALDHLFVAVDRAYRNGANIVILSDRGVDENHVAIPSLLAAPPCPSYWSQRNPGT